VGRLQSACASGSAGFARQNGPVPTLAKRSFNADTAHIAGLSSLGLKAVSLFYGTEESHEGVRAFQEKRKPKFRD
jgi:1,4-dihydroxy-2-naphthoyl-CoA synthase